MIRRMPLIVGNWKMNKNCTDSIEYAKNVLSTLGEEKRIEVLLAPPYTFLLPIISIIKNSNIKLAAQNIFFEQNGAFTGEISAKMIKTLGCEYTIVGHSERRKIFNENNKIINKKIKSAIKHALIPILCVGESKSEKIGNKTFAIIRKQIKFGLADIEEKFINEIIIAYEPIWAIGSENPSSPDYAQKIHNYIRRLVGTLHSKTTSNKIRIIYGGSVSIKNIKSYMTMPDIDGVLIGKNSLDYIKFSKIVLNAIRSK